MRKGIWDTGERKATNNPYQVRVALADAGYRCTCPSRKQPCKHTLALLYLYAGGASFPNSAPPAFVEEWLANRAKRADAKATRESQPSAGSAPQPQPRDLHWILVCRLS
jgi:hypothetical protein